MQKNTAFANEDSYVPGKAKLNANLLFIMRVSVFCCTMVLITLQLFAYHASRGQTIDQTRINFEVKNESLKNALKELQDQSGFTVMYPSEKVAGYESISLSKDIRTISDILTRLLMSTDLDFKQVNNTIVLFEKPAVKTSIAVPAELIKIKVVDTGKQPLPGVTIKIKNDRALGTTNRNGEYSFLSNNKNAILVFSFVGYRTVEIPIRSMTSPFTVVMKEAMGSLDDVEILAYGTVTKRLSTSDVVTISAAEIEKSPVTNVLEAIQNKVPGLFIQQKTGNVGGAFTVKIRPGNAVSTLNNPLIILNGVTLGNVIQLGALAGHGNANVFQGGNVLNYLDPDDIESVSILKDADATALYGSRGAYGVMLITTKKGKNGPPKFHVNVYDGISVAGELPALLNTQQYLALRAEALRNDGLKPGLGDLDLNGTWPATRFTDFRKYFLGTAAQDQNVNLNYSGGSGNTNFLISGNIRHNQSLQLAKGGDISGGGTMDLNSTSANGKFFIDLSLTYSLNIDNQVPADLSIASLLAPNAPLPINPDGSLDWSNGTNAAAALNTRYNNTTSSLTTSLTLGYKILKTLTLNSVISYNQGNTNELRESPTSAFVPTIDVNTKTTSEVNLSNTKSVTVDPNLDYKNIFFKKLTLEGIGGFTVSNTPYNYVQITGTGFASDALLSSPTSSTTTPSTYYTSTPQRYIGYFGRSTFNWEGKYLLSASVRRDGSDLFGPGNRFGTFGALGGAWILTEEPWLKELSNVLSFAKIRGSYGTTGGSTVAAGSYLNTFSVTSGSGYSGSIGLIPNRIANPDLHWESKKSAEIGLNLQFFNGRIEFDGSYSRSHTSNSLTRQTESLVTGFSSVTINAPGVDLESSSIEGQLATVNIQTKNFSWKTNINVTIPHSVLKSYPGLTKPTDFDANFSYLELGKPVTGVRLYNYAGVDPATGAYSFTNAQGVTGNFSTFNLSQTADKNQFIDLAPKFTGGMTNSFSYKRFGLDFFLAFQRLFELNYQGQQNPVTGYFGQFDVNGELSELNRWQKPGDITNVPKLTAQANPFNPFNNSTGAYTDVFYVKLQNLSFRYELPEQFLKKIGVPKMNVYLRCQNLLTFSKFKDDDPESANVQTIGPLRTIVAGFNLTL